MLIQMLQMLDRLVSSHPYLSPNTAKYSYFCRKMLSHVGQEDVVTVLDEGWGEDGDDFVTSLFNDVDGGGILQGADAKVALRHEDPESGCLHSVGYMQRKVL